MLGAIFEGYIVSKYGSYDVPKSGFKYLHCDLIDLLGYFIVTLIANVAFVTTFSHLNVGSYIRIVNFGPTFKNKFEKSDWGFVLRVGTIIVIKHIDAFPFCL